jgi:hypothetical protein
MKSQFLFVLGFGVIAACGGSVENGGAGGASGSGGVSSGGSGGSVSQTCSGIADCCQKACALAVQSVKCPNPPTAGCVCNIPKLPQDCEIRLTSLYKCALKVGASAFACDSSGDTNLRCNACSAEFSAMVQACGADAQCAN